MENNLLSEERHWGGFSVLKEYPDVKVKHLYVKPSKGISFQRHKFRNELWFIQEGEATIRWARPWTKNPNQNYHTITKKRFETQVIEVDTWHQVINNTTELLHIIEIQYGDKCVEEDIERLSYYDI